MVCREGSMTQSNQSASCTRTTPLNAVMATPDPEGGWSLAASLSFSSTVDMGLVQASISSQSFSTPSVLSDREIRSGSLYLQLLLEGEVSESEAFSRQKIYSILQRACAVLENDDEEPY
jgi:hypothetical protein